MEHRASVGDDCDQARRVAHELRVRTRPGSGGASLSASSLAAIAVLLDAAADSAEDAVVSAAGRVARATSADLATQDPPGDDPV